ncbi:hypothetical protein EJV47_21445 [Hymenobacter gummosus]|uniref:Uncharacterized protein n=1 Tax=Hymenobacter gummosus TaxID=1776032 RepID=A0A431TXB5_9BACT|nr:hypothetical protein [Hymenobacter gummosus]RTQ46520.1 hypothetical protein EJV47_21445 [Hymenobacter gummosus]
MAYSISDLTTRAECEQVTKVLVKKRDEAANRRTNLAFELQNFGDPAARAAELTRLNRRITDAQTDLPTMPDGREKRKVENELSSHTRQRNTLLNQADAQGSDDRVLLEFELFNVAAAHDEAVRLITEVEAHRNTLSA